MPLVKWLAKSFPIRVILSMLAAGTVDESPMEVAIAKIISSMFFCDILSTWIGVKDLKVFDSAFCLRRFRTLYLELLRKPCFAADVGGEIKYCSQLRWVNLRGVKLMSLAFESVNFQYIRKLDVSRILSLSYSGMQPVFIARFTLLLKSWGVEVIERIQKLTIRSIRRSIRRLRYSPLVSHTREYPGFELKLSNLIEVRIECVDEGDFVEWILKELAKCSSKLQKIALKHYDQSFSLKPSIAELIGCNLGLREIEIISWTHDGYRDLLGLIVNVCPTTIRRIKLDIAEQMVFSDIHRLLVTCPNIECFQYKVHPCRNTDDGCFECIHIGNVRVFNYHHYHKHDSVDQTQFSEVMGLNKGLQAVAISTCHGLIDSVLDAITSHSCGTLTEFSLCSPFDHIQRYTYVGLCRLIHSCKMLSVVSLRECLHITLVEMVSLFAEGNVIEQLTLIHYEGLMCNNVKQIARKCPRLARLTLVSCMNVINCELLHGWARNSSSGIKRAVPLVVQCKTEEYVLWTATKQ